MYYGEFSSTLDEKGRITVPRPFRVTMEAHDHAVWYMTRGFDRCVSIYNQEEWNKLRGQLSQHGSMHTRALDFRRMLFGSVAVVKPDGQGRMTVAPHLREYAGLEKEAVLLGVEDHLELWNRESLRDYQERVEPDYRNMAGSLFEPEGDTAAVAAPGAAPGA
jgi:MraZ protein